MAKKRGIQRAIFQLWPVALALILLVLVAGGQAEKAYKAVLSPIAQYNDTFLETSIRDTAQLMLPIGLAKGAADIIEGTTLQFEAGVVFANAGTEMEVGDVLQPVLDYLNIAWRILILSIMFSIVTKSVLQGAYPVAHIMLLVSLSGFSLWYLFKPWLKETNAWLFSVERVAKMTLLAAIVFMLVLPFSVYLAAHLSRATTAPLEASLFQSFDEVGQHFDMSDFHSIEKITDKAKFLYQKSLELMKYSLTATKDIALSVARLFVIKILNGVVFPLGALAFLLWLLRGVLYPALGLSQTGLAREDFKSFVMWTRSADKDVAREEREALGLLPGPANTEKGVNS
ncbi:MAG: hypothetical protein JEZ02_02090 [Desulfatibacillum sp.]|nr:hypothetical protein [Desulfatibacillum sp.]